MQIKFIHASIIMIFLALISVSCDTVTSTVVVPEKTSDDLSTLTRPTTTVIPTIEETQALACLPSLSSTVSLDKGILFYEYDGAESSDKTRVWLWSKNMSAPQKILEIPANVKLFLSPNGEKLVWHEFGTDHFVLYDLISKEQRNFNWESSWQFIHGWKDNETVSISVNHENVFNIGTKEENVYFDVPRETFTSEAISLNLPGYSLGPSVDGPLDGFAIMDPTESVVLYTAYVNGTPNMSLIKRDTGEILWENKIQYPYYPQPDWTSDGDRVAFVIYDESPYFYTLSKDGKTSEIIGEGAHQRVIRDIKWSPDEKYIYYSYWDAIDEGPASIVNMDTKERKEICTPGYTFLRGTWLPNDFFAYIVREGEQTNQDGLAEVRVLNTKDWTYQTIFRTNTKVGPTTGFTHELEVLGWTPLSL
jgi:hypothetical protein